MCLFVAANQLKANCGNAKSRQVYVRPQFPLNIFSFISFRSPPSSDDFHFLGLTRWSQQYLSASIKNYKLSKRTMMSTQQRDSYRTFASSRSNRSKGSVQTEFKFDEGPPTSDSASLLSHHRRHSSAVPLCADNIPRLVKRNLPNYQSKQKVAIENRNLSAPVRKLRYMNWFHVFLRWETKRSVLALILLWTAVVTAFAVVYRQVDSIEPERDCGLASEAGQVIDFAGAFAFSLETCTTVGYGLPGGHNGFFESCPGLQVAIYFQMVFSMFFNAFLFAFFFARLARSEKRGVQLLFSNKAIIEYRNGKWLFHARVYDLDASHPLVEIHVRLYAVCWMDYELQDKQPHLLHTMRLLQPNDDLGGMLFTSVPSAVTHHIDSYSPLTPFHLRDDESLVQRNGLALREVDRMVENYGGIPCPVCGEVYGTHENLKRHIKYNKLIESADPNIPVEGSHQEQGLEEGFEPFEMSEAELRVSLQDKEIMVVCEGIEPLVSGTFQALQSYTSDDIVFGGRFAPCLFQKHGKIFVDLEKFHRVIPSTPTSSSRKTLVL